jgi:ribosomal protein S18 acetylase RimI-like enzyme
MALSFRAATEEDLPAIVGMLADDKLGQTRERYADPLPGEYRRAFAAIMRQEGNRLIVAVDGGAVAGCLQLTFIPGLSRMGMMRAQIESVRVDSGRRGRGVGEALIRHAIALSREAGCGLAQLATDKSRPEALRFYERLGFKATHEGMKLAL